MSQMKASSVRSFGVDFVGDIEWGTHLCQFFQTKKDLSDLLVPYFAEGLRNNEFCMWVTAPPLEAEEAKRALRKVVPGLDQLVAKGQIEIVPYTEWYLFDGEFDADLVLQGWVEKERIALDRGFEGLRLAGNTFWLKRKDWRNFEAYEAKVNGVVKSRRMIVFCSYPLRKCTGNRFADVVRNHASILIRKNTSWALVEDVAQRKKAEEELQAAKRDWELTFDSVPDMIALIDCQHRIVRANRAMAKRLGTTPERCEGLDCFRWIHGADNPPDFCPHLKTICDGKEHVAEVHDEHLGGDFLISTTPLMDEQGRMVGSVHVARDVTEFKKAEVELRNIAKFPSENPNPVLRVSARGTILYSNAAGLPFLNQRKCRVGGLAPDSWRAIVVDSLDSGTKKEFEENYGQSTFSFLAVPISASGYVNIYGRDITERRRAEQALQENQRDLNRAQAVARTGSWRLDVHRNVLLWSDETHRMFGIPKGTTLTYEAFLGTVHPDDREYVDQKWKAALIGERYDIEHRIIVDGEIKWVRERAELEFSEDGVLLGGFGTVQDITERKQIQDSLFQSERKYRTLYETTLDGIVSADMNGHINECNDAYASMLGYSKDQLKVMTYQQLTPEKWHQMEEEIVREQITRRGYSDLYEKEYIRKDGSIFPISIRVWLIRDEKWKPVGMWGIVRDITRSKRLENELKRYSEHLERLVEERTKKLKDAERLAAIGETAAMVGHDIRNPLQTVEGAVYLAKEEIRAMPSRTSEIDTVEEMLNTIKEEAAYVDKIVSDLQDFARRLEPQLEEADTQQLINGTLASLQVPENIEVSVTVGQDCRSIIVDPTMMKRILTNLVTNALQAMPNGGKLTIAAFRKQDKAHVRVQDTGQGIPEEDKEKIFEPLFSTKAKGQGFGLPVVKRLVEAHNGTIAFDSEVGKGTAFTIMIPIAKEAS